MSDEFDLPPCRPVSAFVAPPDSHYRDRAIDQVIKMVMADMRAADEARFHGQLAGLAGRAGVDADIPARLIPSTGQYIPSATEALESERARQQSIMEREIESAREADVDAANNEHARVTGLMLTPDQKSALPIGPRENAARTKLETFHRNAAKRDALKRAYYSLPERPRAEAEQELAAWEQAKREARAKAEREAALNKAKREAAAAAERLASLESIEVSQ